MQTWESGGNPSNLDACRRGSPCPATAGRERSRGASKRGTRQPARAADVALAGAAPSACATAGKRRKRTRPAMEELGTCTLDASIRRFALVRRRLRRAHFETTLALAAAAEAKDPYMKTHSQTVATYANIIAQRMRVDAPLIAELRVAAMLHDVGKIAIPDAILTKPGPLTADEFAVVKQHPQKGMEILSHVSFLSGERALILYHHERYDGQGYPAGLQGERIPLGARILAVADSIDAMFSPRIYKSGYSVERVRSELISGAGKQFDPNVAEVALGCFRRKDRRTHRTPKAKALRSQ